MQLQDYLTRTEISPSAFAEKMGVPASTVTRWLRGERTPRIDKILEIEEVTKGAVPAEAWAGRAAASEPSEAA